MVAVHPELDALLGRTVAALESLGVPDEALAVIRPARFLRRTAMRPAGRAWRLGVLLIDRSRRLYSTGTVTRAIEPLRAVTNLSAEADARRDDRRTAARSPFPEGEVVNFDFIPIDLDAAALARGTGPLSLRDGVVMLRWNPADRDLRPLDAYLDDRLDLLRDG